MRVSSIISLAAILCLAAITAPALAQSSDKIKVDVIGDVTTPSNVTTFPIELRGNHIYVDATVNGIPVRMIVDNGTSVNILTPAAAKRLGLKGTFHETGEGATTVESSGTIVDTMRVGDAIIRNAPTFLVPLPDEAECDGFFGAPLFNLFRVTIDYENKRITLAEPAVKFAAPGALSLPLQIQDNLALVDATVDGIRGRFQTDTGNKSSLILFSPFVAKHHLRETLTPRIKTITGQGIGGFTYGDITRIPSLTLGSGKSAVTLDKVDGELSYQTEGGFYSKTLAGNLGGEILSRFTVTFDYPHRRLYLQKNKKFGEPFIGNRSGLGLTYVRPSGGGGVFKVTSVIPDSPAAQAGISTGDTIVTVDGLPTEKHTPQDTRARFRQPVGTAVRLEIIPTSGGAAKTVSLILRELI